MQKDREIIFTEDYQVQDKDGATFEKGQTLECNESTEQHYLRKGVAITMEDFQKVQDAQAEKEKSEKLEKKSDTEAAKPAPQKNAAVTAPAPKAESATKKN